MVNEKMNQALRDRKVKSIYLSIKTSN